MMINPDRAMKFNARTSVVVEQRRAGAPALEFVGIVAGNRDRLSGIVGDQRVIAIRDKSARDRVEYRLYAEKLPRKPRPPHVVELK
jgi:hypothetical protein